MRKFAAALALVALSGCATGGPSPQESYRAAFQRAVAAGQCTGPEVREMWGEYNGWYDIASNVQRRNWGTLADALVTQGDTFQRMGCPAVAKVSYDEVLKRFVGPAYGAYRDRAMVGLDDLRAQKYKR